MKTSTKIIDINHEDVVDFLSTALYGNNIFGADYNVEDYNKCDDKQENDYFEDKMSRILLNGGRITIFDAEAQDEDDFYGTLEHYWDDEDETMNYYVSLDDIKSGIEKAFDAGGHSARCATRFIDRENLDFDADDGMCILQYVVFGEEVYG